MKIDVARAQPFSADRRRGPACAPAEAPLADEVQFLGIPEAELTPAVKAALAALAVELEGLRGEAKRLKAQLAEAEAAADTDPLTSVKNRRAFLRELRRASAFAQRYGSPASLVYVDLDGLKAINDRFGHPAGDAAVKAVAERLATHVRESDVVGRLGGDEFAVLLVQADQASAKAAAERLASLVEAEPIETGAWLTPVKISWGVWQIDPAKDPETQIAEADQAMFAMKRERKLASLQARQ
jgi:diguanylate cyclase (GGDEF)-like protein